MLGRFVPSEFVKETIEREVKAHLDPCCACERVGVRVPHAQAVVSPEDNRAWHQDGMPAYHMVVWASEMPTEIRTSDGDIYVGEPFDLVWFDNTKAFHRQPSGTDETRRWFLAVRCNGTIF